MGATKNQGAEHKAWSSTALRIGQALLDAPVPLAPGDLARRIEVDQTHVRNTAEQMSIAGLLTRSKPPARAGRGRPPSAVFSLTPAGEAELRSHLGAEPTTGGLRKGQHVVSASLAGSQSVAVDTALQSLGSAEAYWSATTDGSRQGRVVVFSGTNAFGEAEDFVAALKALGVECERVVITDIASGRETKAAARRRSNAATTAQEKRATSPTLL